MNFSRDYSQEELAELEKKATQFHEVLVEQKLNDESIENMTDNLCVTTNEERQIIRSYYKKSYNHPIQKDIKDQLKEDYSLLGEIMIDMFDTPYEYDARELRKAFQDNLVDEDIIIEIFSSRPKEHLNTVDLAYKKFYNVSLKEEIKNQLSPLFANYLLLLMDTDRAEEQTLSGDEAYALADELISNGPKVYAEKIELYKKLFVEKSRIDLILVSRAYYEKTEKCLIEIIVEDKINPTSLYNEKADMEININKNIKLIRTLLFTVITPAEYFSKNIIKSLKNYNTDIHTLIRILITRREIDTDAINEYYTKETNNDLKNDIENEKTITSYPHVGKILLSLASVE